MKVVKYHDCMPVTRGEPARLFPMDHPHVANDRWVTTTPVVNIICETKRGPIFETRNTQYRPATEWKSAYPQVAQENYA